MFAAKQQAVVTYRRQLKAPRRLVSGTWRLDWSATKPLQLINQQ
jgi:hypothetical protein